MAVTHALLPDCCSPWRYEIEVLLIPTYLALRQELLSLHHALAAIRLEVDFALGDLQERVHRLHGLITLQRGYLALRDAGLEIEAALTILRGPHRPGQDGGKPTIPKPQDIEDLDAAERRLLKQALRRVVKGTHPDSLAQAEVKLFFVGLDAREYLADAIEANVRGDVHRAVATETVLSHYVPRGATRQEVEELPLTSYQRACHLRKAIESLLSTCAELRKSEMASLLERARMRRLEPADVAPIAAELEFALTVGEGWTAQLAAEIERLGSADVQAVARLRQEFTL